MSENENENVWTLDEKAIFALLNHDEKILDRQTSERLEERKKQLLVFNKQEEDRAWEQVIEMNRFFNKRFRLDQRLLTSWLWRETNGRLEFNRDFHKLWSICKKKLPLGDLVIDLGLSTDNRRFLQEFFPESNGCSEGEHLVALTRWTFRDSMPLRTFPVAEATARLHEAEIASAIAESSLRDADAGLRERRWLPLTSVIDLETNDAELTIHYDQLTYRHRKSPGYQTIQLVGIGLQVVRSLLGSMHSVTNDGHSVKSVLWDCLAPMPSECCEIVCDYLYIGSIGTSCDCKNSICLDGYFDVSSPTRHCCAKEEPTTQYERRDLQKRKEEERKKLHDQVQAQVEAGAGEPDRKRPKLAASQGLPEEESEEESETEPEEDDTED